jgi:hypothetical protein
VVRRKRNFDCGGYKNVLLEDVDLRMQTDKLGIADFREYIGIRKEENKKI